jgi:hypothetical protein
MKKTLIAFSILLASVAHAGEITQDQFNQVLKQNSATFMNVTEGMTADYSQTIKHEGGVECNSRRKEVIVGVQAPVRYLVYVKETRMNDCFDSMKGEVEEYLQWNDIEKPYFGGNEIRVKSINLEQNVATLKYTVLDEDMNAFEMTSLVDVTQSQFSTMFQFNVEGAEETKLLRRSQTDVKTIDIENLEIFE